MRFLRLPALVMAAAFAIDQGWFGKLPTEPALGWIGRGTLTVAFLLAWRFRRGRLAAAALLLAGTAEVSRLAPAGVRDLLVASAACLVPLNLGLLALLTEWRVASSAGLIRYAALALQAGAIWAMAQGFPTALATWLGREWIPSLPSTTLSQSTLLAFGSAALVLLLSLLRRGTAEIAALTGVLAATFAAFELTDTPLLYLAAGGLILVLTQIENAFSLAFEDGLTGLPARRALEESLRHLGRRYAIAMIDIDHFKRLNDRHGHEVGDQVLRAVASRLSKVKGGGTAHRYGGEEFTVLFPRGAKKEVEPHLEELRRAIADDPFVVRGLTRPKKKPKKGAKTVSGTKRLKVTVSIGVAERNARLTHPEQVLKAADKALYRAKRAGRNRVVVG